MPILKNKKICYKKTNLQKHLAEVLHLSVMNAATVQLLIRF